MAETKLPGLEGKAPEEIGRLVADAFASGSDTVYVHIEGKDKAAIAAVIKLGFAIEGEEFNEGKQRNEIVFSLSRGDFHA
jgi:hypothetical protein